MEASVSSGKADDDKEAVSGGTAPTAHAAGKMGPVADRLPQNMGRTAQRATMLSHLSVVRAGHASPSMVWPSRGVASGPASRARGAAADACMGCAS